MINHESCLARIQSFCTKERPKCLVGRRLLLILIGRIVINGEGGVDRLLIGLGRGLVSLEVRPELPSANPAYLR